jgi:glycosyltransferase involved in cell wall biosynthesis
MHHGVPVLARDCGGVAEALGGAGVLFDGLQPREVAALLDQVLSDGALRGQVLDSQRARLAELAERRLDDELRDLLDTGE